MDAYRETEIRIDFDRGYEIKPVCVYNGIEEPNHITFHKLSHEIEELLEFIEHKETGGYDVYL